MAAVGMIAIWGQSQVADIDATNTLFAALTAMCGIELLIIGNKSVIPGHTCGPVEAVWIFGAGLAWLRR